MGGKKKTKWRKLPLGELTQGTARGCTSSGSLREQAKDGLHENDFGSHHQQDATSDEHQWRETTHAGYYAQGPPHLYSTTIAPHEQDDAPEEEGIENDGKTGILLNGFWIPESDLDQFNIIRNPSAYEPFFRQVPVFFCPPIMPYCSAPYPHLRPAYHSDAPLFSSFCIPSDPHYYYHFTRPRTTVKEDEDQSNESKVENTCTLELQQDIDDEERGSPQEPGYEDNRNQTEQHLTEMTPDNTLSYPYPGYGFGEPLYAAPVYPLLPPTPRAFPRLPWSASQTQRKRRRKRREYNADYAVIPPTRSPSQGNPGATDSNSDLGVTRNETTFNNKGRSDRKGNDTHSVSATGSYPLSKEAKQNECPLNNRAHDDVDAQTTNINQRATTTEDVTRSVESTVTTDHKEIPQNEHCEITNNHTSEEKKTEEQGLISEVLCELVQKVASESQGERERCWNNKFTCDNQLKHQGTDEDAVTEFFSNSDDNPVVAVESENTSTETKMERALRKNPNSNFPEVHRKVQGDLSVDSAGAHSFLKKYYNNETSGNFVESENRKNLSRGRPVKLCVKEERFFDVSLVDEDAREMPTTEDGQIIEVGGNEQMRAHNNNEKEDNVTENKHAGVQDDCRDADHSDLGQNIPTENQNDSSSTEQTDRTQLDSRNTSKYLDLTPDNSRVTDLPRDDQELKNGEDGLDSLTSNDSFRDKQLSDSHRSSPHSFLSFANNSEALIRETELELSKIQHLTSRPPLQANQSIYKFAFDENLTDQSDTEDTMTPIPSPTPELSHRHTDAVATAATTTTEEDALSAEMRQDPRRSEIVVHEGDSGSEAGSEDIELLPHRYESQCGDKHLYVNKLSLAVELLRTHEKLPYDDEFKRVVEDESESTHGGKVDARSTSQSDKITDVSSGTANPAFVGDTSPQVQAPGKSSSPMNVVNTRPGFQKSPALSQNLQESEQVQHRHSRISAADSGVQSEDSGDEICEEGKEVYGRLGFTECEEQELWNPASDATVAYRRFGAQAPHRFNIFTPRAGGLNPCFCCVIM